MQKQKVVNAFTEGAHDSKSERNDVSKMKSKELSFGGVGLGASKLKDLANRVKYYQWKF